MHIIWFIISSPSSPDSSRNLVLHEPPYRVGCTVREVLQAGRQFRTTTRQFFVTRRRVSSSKIGVNTPCRRSYVRKIAFDLHDGGFSTFGFARARAGTGARSRGRPVARRRRQGNGRDRVFPLP